MKIDYNDLEYDYEKGLELHKGLPFSGIAFEKLRDGGWVEVMMTNGVKSGITREWYPTGILKEECHMENNYRHGIFWNWDESGSLIRQGIYEYNVLIHEEKWDSKGEQISTYKIREDNRQYKNLCIHRKYRRTNFFGIPKTLKE